MSLTDLRNVARIMRAQGWHRGARLQEIWFSLPPATAPNYGPPDVSTIRMDWVLSFPRARAIHDRMIADRVWANEAARGVIAGMLRRQGLLSGGSSAAPRRFGDLTRTAPRLDPDHINFRPVGSGYASGYSYSGYGYSGYGYSGYSGYDGRLDDMIAALGNFVFRVAVAGSVQPAGNGRHRVTIDRVGIYVRDSFDFNGSQFLGFWNERTNSVSVANPLSGTAVFNGTYRDWRAANGRGGDFLVYSDVRAIALTHPDTFEV